MDTKIEIKEEDPLFDGVTSQNEKELITKNAAMMTNSNAVFLDENCDMSIKMEIKSEAPYPDFCLQKEEKDFAKHLVKQSKSETVTCSNNCKMNIKTEIEEQTLVADFDSQNERGCLQVDSIWKVKEYNNDHEMDSKEDCWQLEINSAENSSICDEIKDDDFPPVKSPRSCVEAVFGDTSGKSLLSFSEELRKDASLYMEKNSPVHGHSRNSKSQRSYITEKHSVKQNIHLEYSQLNIGGQTYSKPSYLKQKKVIQEIERSYKCKICEKEFIWLSALKRHNLIHEGKKPHKCEICEKRFIKLSDLKRHNLIHEGIKPHKCTICEKRFTIKSNLKKHSLIHEGIKPHKCEICEKKFTHLSVLKTHNLIHEGKKPHKCAICEKSFTELSNLKRHNLIHEGKKSHKCAICEKTFTLLSHLKMHNLIHEGKRPHKCEICKKRFIRLPDLKKHYFVHEGKGCTIMKVISSLKI